MSEKVLESSTSDKEDAKAEIEVSDSVINRSTVNIDQSTNIVNQASETAQKPESKVSKMNLSDLFTPQRISH